jgi:hypothetical protein
MTKLALAVLLFVPVIFASEENLTDEKLIARVKDAPVSRLDPALPSIAFEQWLRTEGGTDARYEWEVNDCGEQTGSPAKNPSQIPTCVEADAWLKDGREIIIIISVSETDGTEKAQQFAVFFAQLVSMHEKITLRHLSDLPAALVRTHEPAKNPEMQNEH